MSNIIRTTTAVDRLNKSLAKSSLDDLVKARTKRSLLLVDVSGSMADWIQKTHERKIDALRKVVATLRETHAVPTAAFGTRGGRVQLVDSIPNPSGSTPLDAAIEFGTQQGATHLVVVTDGYPDSQDAAFRAAREFGGPIDVFYVGDGNDEGARFAAELAAMTGGTCGVTDLANEPKQLAGKIVALLGDGSEVL